MGDGAGVYILTNGHLKLHRFISWLYHCGREKCTKELVLAPSDVWLEGKNQGIYGGTEEWCED